MIAYNEGYLGIRADLLLRVRGSVVPKSLLWALPAALCSVALHTFWGDVDLDSTSSVSQAWTGYGFILGFLICMRMQMAYHRYWEAVSRTNRMRGELMDSYMSTCSFCTTDETRTEEVKQFKALLMRLYSMLHQALMSKLQLGNANNGPIIDPRGIEPECLEFLMSHPDKVYILMVWIEQCILQGAKRGTVPVAPPILTRVFSELSRGMVEFKNVMKIRIYNIPFPIVQMIQVLLIFNAILSPIIASLIMYNWRWAAMLSFSSVFSLWSINYIAMEVEQPFGSHHNSLPVYQMSEEFNEALLVSTEEITWRPPSYSTEGGTATRFSQGAVEIDMAEVSQKMSEGASLRAVASSRKAGPDSSDVAAGATSSVKSGKSGKGSGIVAPVRAKFGGARS